MTRKAWSLRTKPSAFVTLSIKARRSPAGALFSVWKGHIWSSQISRKVPCRPIGFSLALHASGLLNAINYTKIPLFELEMLIIEEFV